MTEDQDNAGEVVAATVRVALTAAGQLAEQAARRREAALRDAERTSAAQVATLQAQLAAERQTALGSVQDVLRRGDTASVEEFTQAWQQISSWNDPVAATARERLRELSRNRFDVDPGTLTSSGMSVEARQAGRDAPTAVAVLGQDSDGQRVDAQRREAGGERDASTTGRAILGIDEEAAQARALAAQSHPTSPTLAARLPAQAPAVRRRASRQKTGTQVEHPGR